MQQADALGVDLRGKRLNLEPRAIQHIARRHGGSETEASQRPVERLDFELIPHVWREPDQVARGDTPGDLVFSKQLLGRSTFITWKTEGGSVNLKTLWVKKEPAR